MEFLLEKLALNFLSRIRILNKYANKYNNGSISIIKSYIKIHQIIIFYLNYL
jgi:hypothetical protein